MPLTLNGTTGVQDNSGAFVAGTAVASTSGTSIDFTSIPSWVKRITVMFNGVSTNGSSTLQLQLGTSGGVDTSGYTSLNTILATGVNTTSFTSGFGLTFSTSYTAASYTYSGTLIISLLGSNAWTLNGLLGSTGGPYIYPTTGSKSLSGTLDRVRITTVNGTDAFDAGTINILFE